MNALTQSAPTTYTLTLTARQHLLLRALTNEATLAPLREGLALLGLTDVTDTDLELLWHRLRFARTQETVAQTLAALPTAEDVVIYAGAVSSAVERELALRSPS